MYEQDVTKVYEMLLCSPGMNETIKLDQRISRKTILLLSQVIEKGLSGKPKEIDTGLASIAGKESIDELNELVSGSLEKAGLTVLNAKLLELHR